LFKKLATRVQANVGWADIQRRIEALMLDFILLNQLMAS